MCKVLSSLTNVAYNAYNRLIKVFYFTSTRLLQIRTESRSIHVALSWSSFLSIIYNGN